MFRSAFKSYALIDALVILNKQFQNSNERWDVLIISCEIVLMWMPEDLTDD